MNRKQEIALLEAIEEFSKSIFQVIGKKKGEEWAIKVSNNGYDKDKFTTEEYFFFNSFQLSKLCHKIIYDKTQSDSLFYVPKNEKGG